jgi:hypothetical protein
MARPTLKWGVQSTREWGEKTVTRTLSRHATKDEAEAFVRELKKKETTRGEARIEIINRAT